MIKSVSNIKSGYIRACIITLLIVCANIAVLAQFTNENFITGSSDLFENATLELPVEINSVLQSKTIFARAFISLDLGPVYKLGILNGFSAAFNIEVTELNSSDQVMGSATTYQLNISNYIENQGVEQIKLYEIQNDIVLLKKLRLKITSTPVYITDDLTSEALAVFDESIRLGIRYEIDLGFKVVETNGTIANIKSPVIDVEPQSRIAKFTWGFDGNNGNYTFQNYQFELLKLENYLPDVNNDQTISTKVNWSNALKIETQTSEKSLTITLSEGTGYYTWRVRPIGSYYNGGIANFRNWGKWSESLKQGDEKTMSKNSGESYVFYFEDPEDASVDNTAEFNKNWIYSRFFAEGGKIKEQITYANGLNQVKQTQTYIPSQEKTIANQTILDFSGRPSLVTLPVPVDGRISHYIPSLVTDQNGKLYDASNFDTDEKVMEPDKIKQDDVDSKYSYYSELNTDDAVPDAGGYPFSRTLFKDDPTGRQAIVSGVGPHHRLGANEDGKGTVRMFYGNPSNIELIRIFGDEAPDEKSVLKTTTIDQNNTISITYTSKEGNVIATSLSEDEDGTLTSIENAQISEENVKALIKKNLQDGNRFYAQKKITFSFPTNLTLTYTVPYEELMLGCYKIADGDCGYHIKFEIVDIATGDIYETQPTVLTNEFTEDNPYVIDLNSADWATSLQPILMNDGKLKAGAYIFRKIIIATKSAGSQVTASKERTREDIKPLVELFQGWLKRVDNDEELLQFYQDVQKFSDALEEAHSKFEGQEINYDEVYLKENQGNFSKVLNPDEPYQLGGAYLGDFLFVPEAGAPDPESKAALLYRPGHHVRFVGEESEIIALNNLDEQPRYIEITGTCSACGPIIFPIQYIPEIQCHTYDELILEPDKGPDLWLYTKDILKDIVALSIEGVDHSTQYTEEEEELIEEKMSTILSDYDRTSLNTMAYYMLTDKYATNEEELQNPKVQYTCPEIVSTWKGVVASYKDIVEQSNSLDITTIHQATEDEDENNGKDEEEGGSKDNFFDDAPLSGGFIMKWIMKRAMSKRMRDLEGVPTDDTQDAEPIDIDVDYGIVPNFLNQVGYKFANIIEVEPDDAGAADYFTRPDLQCDFSSSATSCVNKQSGIYYDSEDYLIGDPYTFRDENNDTKIKPQALPFIRNKVYAFKYFEYNKTILGESYYPVEVNNCYYVDNSELDYDKLINKCYNPCQDGYDHRTWEADKRFEFYTNLSVFNGYNAGPMDDDPSIAELEAEAQDNFDAMKAQCPSLCENRRQNTKDQIMQLFLNNCYDINGCPSMDNIVLESDINIMTDEVIDACTQQCNSIFDGGFSPTYNTSVCYQLVKTPQVDIILYGKKEYDWGEPIGEHSVVFALPEAQLQQYEQIRDWNLVVGLDTDFHGSFCHCFDGFSASQITEPWKASETYYINTSTVELDDSKLVLNAKQHIDQAGYAALYRSDFNGDFEISVRIDNYVPNYNQYSNLANVEAGLMVTTIPEISKKPESIVNTNFIRIGFIAEDILAVYTQNGTVGQVTVTAGVPYHVKMVCTKGEVTDIYSFYYAEVPEEGGLNYEAIIENTELSKLNRPYISLYLETDGEYGMAQAVFDDFDCGEFDNNEIRNKDWMDNVPDDNYSAPFEVSVEVD